MHILLRSVSSALIACGHEDRGRLPWLTFSVKVVDLGKWHLTRGARCEALFAVDTQKGTQCEAANSLEKSIAGSAVPTLDTDNAHRIYKPSTHTRTYTGPIILTPADTET